MGKQSDRIDRELKLINAVHGIPRLWQKSDEQYKNQTSKGPIWTKLAKSCGYDPEYVGSEDEDEDEEEEEERDMRTRSRKSSGKSPRSSMSSFSVSQAPIKAGSEDFFRRPASVKGGKKRRTARDEVEHELLSMIRLMYERATQQELPPQQEQEQQVGTSASFANGPVDAWGMNGIADDGNSMEALNGDPMLSSTASNSN